MNETEINILLDRLFSAFGKELPTQALAEWQRVARNIRPDDVSSAIDSLINTSNHLPSIAMFRAACLSQQDNRIVRAGEPPETPKWAKVMYAGFRKEDFDWWHDRFGSFAPQARSIIGNACVNGGARQSQRFATEINRLHASGVPFNERYEAIKSMHVEPSKTLPASVVEF